MLRDDVDRYITLRRNLGYKLVRTEHHLHRFAHYIEEQGHTHIRSATALEWVATTGPTSKARSARLRVLVHFARFIHAEDSRHELLPAGVFPASATRPTPYIYTPGEIASILDAAGKLRLQRSNPLRREIYITMFGLIAAAGLRISEAIALRLDDILPNGILHIRKTKFGKSRFVPLHPSVTAALEQYLDKRRCLAGTCEYLFPSVQLRKLCPSTVNHTFRCLLRHADIASGHSRQPRIHDLRHTFATRALEQCGASDREVGRHFVALSTYLGHTDIQCTYWYLQATPEMMVDIASASEILFGSESA